MNRLLLPALGLTAAFCAPAAELKPGRPEAEGTDFIRFVETADGDSLQTAIASYRSPQGVQLDLVGAVHIADAGYFKTLNERFKAYDVVLYELVGRPVEARDQLQPGDGDSKLQWLGEMQEKMRAALKLESQLKGIDYKAKNFVHADLSTEKFFEKQSEKKENFLTLWLKAAITQAASSAPTAASSDLTLLMTLLMSRDSATDLKRLIAREFDRVEQLITGVEGGNGTVIIGERNKHALEVLGQQIAAGRRKAAIFYGAAHFPDMEQRLLEEGWKLQKTEWLKAWDIDAE